MDIYKISEKDVEPIADACGEIRELYDAPAGNLSIAKVTLNPRKEGEWHMHKKMEEVYYTQKSYGRILFEEEDEEGKVIDSQELSINWKGNVISIPKNVWHKIVNDGANPLELLVITHPNYDKDDLILREKK